MANGNLVNVEALVKRLVDKPASAINWSVLRAQVSTDEDGQETELNHVGKIKPPPFGRSGKRYWNIEYKELAEVTPMDVEELVRASTTPSRWGTIV
ncbi:hypothetical protein PI125_g25654 [Phytophthora idaei]|nr:hypothetical protein PI125_g25654 [Phytophthora idaei]